MECRKRSNEENGTGSGSRVSIMSSTTHHHLFDKAVTPSDVGKLNRLVIPKQYAEKYFPMDVHSNAKGLLLPFHDAAGKPWRFRYSYWNSSQSYVLTKGWSRFVKDKKLVAGDIVSFHRGTAEPRQLYISFRYRPCSHKQPAPPITNTLVSFSSAKGCYSPQWVRIFWPNYRAALGHMERLACPAASPASLSGAEMPGNVEEAPQAKKKKKEVRVFGVDLAVSTTFGGPMPLPS